MSTHSVVPIRTYILIWLALTVLTVTTWAVAYVDMGSFNIVVALTIAIIKMCLVIIFFMHVKQVDNLTRLFVIAGFFWFLILIVLTGQDYISRGWQFVGRMW